MPGRAPAGRGRGNGAGQFGLIQDMIGCWVFNTGGALVPDVTGRNSVGKTLTTSASWFTDYRSTSAGLAAYNSTTTNGWRVNVPTKPHFNLQRMSFLSWVLPAAVTAGSTIILSSRASDISVTGYEWGMRSSRVAFAYNDGSVQGWYSDTGTTLSANTMYLLGMTWAPGAVRFFVNGAFSSQVATTSGTIVHLAADPYLIGFQGGNSAFSGHYLMHAAWARALTDQEMIAAMNNPDILIEPRGGIDPSSDIGQKHSRVTVI